MAKRKKEAPDPIDRHVGARVKARRTGLGVSQSDLGKVIDVTFQQVQKYENGSNRIGASNLFKIATALGVEVGYFFEGLDAGNARGRGLGEKGQATFDTDPMSNRESVKLVHAYYQIPEEDIRQQIYKLVKTLATG